MEFANYLIKKIVKLEPPHSQGPIKHGKKEVCSRLKLASSTSTKDEVEVDSPHFMNGAVTYLGRRIVWVKSPNDLLALDLSQG